MLCHGKYVNCETRVQNFSKFRHPPVWLRRVLRGSDSSALAWPSSNLGSAPRGGPQPLVNEVNKSGALRVVYTGINIKVWWPHATLFVFFIFLLQYIHSYNYSRITIAEALLHIFIIAAGSVGGTFLGCRAEIRTRACLTASALPTELRCTLIYTCGPTPPGGAKSCSQYWWLLVLLLLLLLADSLLRHVNDVLHPVFSVLLLIFHVKKFKKLENSFNLFWAINTGFRPPPPHTHAAKGGRNHLNEKITHLFPTGIGERYDTAKPYQI